MGNPYRINHQNGMIEGFCSHFWTLLKCLTLFRLVKHQNLGDQIIAHVWPNLRAKAWCPHHISHQAWIMWKSCPRVSEPCRRAQKIRHLDAVSLPAPIRSYFRSFWTAAVHNLLRTWRTCRLTAVNSKTWMDHPIPWFSLWFPKMGGTLKSSILDWDFPL